MTRPSLLTYLFGNPVSALALGLAALWLGYQALTGGASWLVALGAIAVAVYAGKAFDQVEKYRLWKREWDAMSGQPSAGFALGRVPGLRFAAGMALWCLGLYFVVTLDDTPGVALGRLLFWLGTAVMVVGMIYRLVSRSRPKRRAERAMVSVSLPISRNSPARQQAYASLPVYCLKLFPRT